MNPNSKLVLIEKPKKITIQEDIKVLTLASQQGIAGVPGDGETFFAAEDVSYGDILYFKTDGLLYKASHNDPDCIQDSTVSFFMSQTTAAAGNPIFSRFTGKIVFTSNILTPGNIYYLGVNGQMTDTPPTTGVILIIGSAITETDFFLNFQQPILLRQQ
jgi:hypothetical protein